MSQPSTVETATADQAGPIDYLILAFPSGHADAGAFATLRVLAQQDLIRVLDLEFVARADDGTVALVDPAAAIAAADGDLSDFLGATSGLLDDDDVRHLGDIQPPGSLMAIVIYENEWLVALAQDLNRADATILGTGSIPLHEIDAALGRD
jgi:hypothetical protein